MIDSCPQCGLTFERHEGYWLGAIAINTGIAIVVFIVALVLPIVLTWPDPPWTAISIALVTLAVVVPIAAYPLSKTLWVALEIGMHPVHTPPSTRT